MTITIEPLGAGLSAFLFLIGLIIGVLPHELGHAAAAKLVGIRILTINIGVVGPLLLRTRLPGGGWLLVRASLLAGSFTYAQPLHPRRFSEALTVIGGPAGNIAFFAMLAGISTTGWLPSDVARQLALPQLLIAAFNLLPFSVRRGSQRMGLDGAQLLELLRGRKEHLAPALLTWMRSIVPDAELADLSSNTPMIGRCAAALATDAEEWARLDGTASLAALLDGSLTTPDRVLVLSILSEAELLRGGTAANWDDPERWTRELIQFSSTPGTQVLRGAALIRSGSLVEGRALLEGALTGEPPAAVAIASCLYLARAAVSKNDLEAANAAESRAEAIATEAGSSFDKDAFREKIAAAPVRPGRAVLQRPRGTLTRAGLVASIVLATCLSAALAGAFAYRTGLRRGYLAACDERVATTVFSVRRPRGVECGR